MWFRIETTFISVLLVFPCFNGLSRAFKISPFQKASRPATVAFQYEDDLSSLLYTKPYDQEGVFSSAVQLLNSMKSSPSCNRLAVTDLITSCQELTSEGETRSHPDHAQEDLDHIKSLYAARLAVCEVTGAGAQVPDECEQLGVPSPEKPGRTWFHGYNHNSGENAAMESPKLAPCLQALESKPQWWTSYSNNRQNAAIMCQAARIEVERDELLSHHRNLVDVTFGLGQSLNQSLSDARREAERQQVFLVAVDEMRLRLMSEMKDNESMTRDLFKVMVADLEASFQQTVAQLHTHIATAGSGTAVLSKDIQYSIASVHDLKVSLERMYSDAMERSTDLAAAEKEQFRANSEMALAVQNTLAEIQQHGLEVVAREFGSIQASLESFRDLVVLINQNHDSLDERLGQFDQAFKHLEHKTDALDAALQRHLENATRLQQDIEMDMRVAQALLHDVTASAANLQTTLSETYQVMSKMGNLRLLSGVVPWWAWFLSLVCLLGLISPRIIALIFVTAAGILSTGAVSSLRHMSIPSSNSMRAISPFEIYCFAGGFFMSVATISILAKKGFRPQAFIPRTFLPQKELPYDEPSYFP